MTTPPLHPTGENRLLTLLPAEAFARLRPHLVPVDLVVGQDLHAPNEPIAQVYFPCGGVSSLVIRLDGMIVVEVATVGNEGMVGLAAFLGGGSVPAQAVCQVAGPALRMSVEVLLREAAVRGPLHRILLRYTQGLINQISQSAACNRAHTIEERCARWLLMTHDRVGRDRFPLTQEFLAQMLGVRRAGVSAAAVILQRAGFIRYSRGVIAIADRPGLESAACGCYRIVRDEFERLLEAGPAQRRPSQRRQERADQR
jgi:CRP-like cAMP-binding protein